MHENGQQPIFIKLMKLFTLLRQRSLTQCLKTAPLKKKFPPGQESPQEFSISGICSNEVTGEPLDKVLVSVVGTGLSDKSNSNGDYGIPGVPDGTFSVRAELANFNPVQVDNVKFVAGTPVTLNFQLKSIV